MEKKQNYQLLLCFESTFEELFSLESIIKLTKDACVDKEISSNYYNLALKDINSLSEERNHYINMLTLALNKIKILKQINMKAEKEICNYKSIPTIAADK